MQELTEGHGQLGKRFETITMNNTLRVRLLLGMQTALLGRVSSNIRAVSCGSVDGNIKVKAIFDGAVMEADRETMDEVGSEIASHFEGSNVEVECVRVDAPQQFRNEILDWCVYLRRE